MGNWITPAKGFLYNAYDSKLFTTVKFVGNEQLLVLAKNLETLHLFSDPNTFINSIICFPFNIKTDEVTTLNPTTDRVYSNLKYGADLQGGGVLDIKSSYVDSEFFFYNMGEYKIAPRFNNYLDYTGYTEIHVFLPYYGWVEIPANDCMNKYLQFRLRINPTTGTGTWLVCVSSEQIVTKRLPYVTVDDKAEEQKIDRIIGTYSCRIGIEIPFNTTNMGEIKRNLLLGAISVGGSMLLTKSLAGAGMFSTSMKQAKKETARNPETGRQVTMSGTKNETVWDSGKRNIASSVQECFGQSMNALNNFRVSATSEKVNDSSMMCCGSNSVQVMIKRPVIVEQAPAYFEQLYGKPVGVADTLNQYEGKTFISYVEMEDPELAKFTQDEIDELEALITSEEGIIL